MTRSEGGGSGNRESGVTLGHSPGDFGASSRQRPSFAWIIRQTSRPV